MVLEDYFQVGAFSDVIEPDHWYRFEARANVNTVRTLDFLDELGFTATFFVAGWIAVHHGSLIREVFGRGHEIAIQGVPHRGIDDFTADEFRRDLRSARKQIEAITRAEVKGFRIGRGRMTPAHRWPLEILAEEGFAYDASYVPLGLTSTWPPEYRNVHRYDGETGSIWEVPASSMAWGPVCMPIAGAYIRHFPNRAVSWAVRRWLRSADSALVTYFHVWELDPGQPRIMSASRLQQIRHYRNVEDMPDRLRRLLAGHRFGSVASYLGLTPEPVRVEPDHKTERTRVYRPAARKQISLVVPCYNEQASLSYLARTLERFALEGAERYQLQLILVDDASTDNTWQELERCFGDWDNCVFVQHRDNRGVAAAIQTGISSASNETVCVIDCDCSYDPMILFDMIPMLQGNVAAVTASPYHKYGRVNNVRPWRLALSKTASWLYGHLLDVKLATYTSICRVYRRSRLIDLELQRGNYVGVTEVLVRLDAEGAAIAELPAVLTTRTLGHSKMRVVRAAIGHARLMATCALWRCRRLATKVTAKSPV